MKKYIYILMAGISLLALSCKKEYVNPYADAEKGASAIKIVKSQLEFTPEASTGIVEVDAEGTITATSDRDWCAVSVSGKQITLSLTANADKETRYALLTIAAGKYTTALSVFQYGEVLGGLGTLSDIASPVEGSTVEVPVKLNVSITLTTEQTWIHPEYAGDRIIVTVDPNDQPETRLGTVSYVAGSSKGSFDVTQYPEIKRPESWVLTAADVTYDHPKYNTSATLSAGDEDMYVMLLVPQSKMEGNDVDAWVFDKLAIEARRNILDQVEANPGTAFKDYLLTGTDPVAFEDVSLGEHYLVAIGFGENSFVSGRYQYKPITITDVRPAYYKWLGQWKVHRKNAKYDAYDTWDISIKEKDVTLLIKGIEGLSNDDGRYDVEATVDEEGRLVLKTQNTKSYEDASRGTVTVLLSGQYTDTAAGKTYYTSKTGVDLLYGTLSEDLNAATLEGAIATGTYPFFNIQFYGRYKKQGSSSYSSVTWNAGTTDIEQTITRIVD